MGIDHVFLRYRQQDFHILAFRANTGVFYGLKIIYDLVNRERGLTVKLPLDSFVQFFGFHARQFGDSYGHISLAANGRDDFLDAESIFGGSLTDGLADCLFVHNTAADDAIGRRRYDCRPPLKHDVRPTEAQFNSLYGLRANIEAQHMSRAPSHDAISLSVG